MFAAKAASTSTKSPQSAVRKPAPQLSRRADRPFAAYAPVLEAKHNQMLGQPRGLSWDFRNISIFPPERGSASQISYPLPGALQRKLKIGAVDDPLEHEADRVADQVMRMPAPAVSMAAAVPQIGRKCAACDQEEKLQKKLAGPQPAMAEAPALVHEVLRSPGQPLNTAARAYFEPRFGQDFSGVRIHADEQAAASARAVNAHAYTVRNNIVFDTGRLAPGTPEGQRLIAHELTHVVQQGGATPRPMWSEETRLPLTSQRTGERARSRISDVIQRAGDPAAIPPGLRCPTDLTPGAPVGTSVLFPLEGSTIAPAHTTLLTTFLTTWLAAGGTDDIIVHGFASTDGAQGPNWTLSCDRAEAVQAELVRLGIPAVRISVVAHGESTDFGASLSSNRRAVVTTHAGILPLPLITGVLTARDNFASRSTTRFGVGEVVDLSFSSVPLRAAGDFGGLQWFLVSGGGALAPGPGANDGTATYTAPPTANAVQLELRVATGATAGRVISSHRITVVIPSGVRMVAVAGTAPSFGGFGAPLIPAGTWGAGFQANVFVDPKDVSFQGVVFGEGTVTAVVTGSFFSPIAGRVHPVNTFGPGHAGNAATGTPVSPPPDGIVTSGIAPTGTLPFFGPTCGAADFLWAIPWEFGVAGGPRTPFAGGFTANHHVTSTFGCNATIDKAGAGPFCRAINGTTC